MTVIEATAASPSEARKLISLGWLPDDQGLWSLNGAVPCSPAVALVVADVLDKMPKKAPPNWWTHLAGTMPGTAGLSIISGVAAAIIANPPPEVGLSPTAVTWLKWALPIAGTLLLGTQVPRSMSAVKEPAKEPAK